MKRSAQNFLIVAGALTALGLPFALAFPRTLLEKLVCVAALEVLSCSHGTPAPAPAATAPAKEDPVAAFEVVRAVLQSPRCVNCHPRGDAPLQGDDGHTHLQFVQRGPEGQLRLHGFSV